MRFHPTTRVGQLIEASAPDETASTSRENTHGVLFVEVCDSTEKTPEQVGDITHYLRIEMLCKHRDKLLMIKNTRDGFLLVYEDRAASFETAERILEFQSGRGEQFEDLRARNPLHYVRRHETDPVAHQSRPVPEHRGMPAEGFGDMAHPVSQFKFN